MRLPFWLEWLIALARSLFTGSARQQGAAEQREASTREAERQEAEDAAVGRPAADARDDPRDILPEEPKR